MKASVSVCDICAAFVTPVTRVAQSTCLLCDRDLCEEHGRTHFEIGSLFWEATPNGTPDFEKHNLFKVRVFGAEACVCPECTSFVGRLKSDPTYGSAFMVRQAQAVIRTTIEEALKRSVEALRADYAAVVLQQAK